MARVKRNECGKEEYQCKSREGEMGERKDSKDEKEKNGKSNEMKKQRGRQQ